jgi:hypothetical protein
LGHDPQFLRNTAIKGKSYEKSLRLGPELQKYMEETARYWEFLRLCEELVQLNEKISDLRPVAGIDDKDKREALKKKVTRDLQEEVEKEVSRLVTFTLRDRERQDHVDLEVLEFHIRSSIHSVGSMLLERLINSDGGDYRGRTLRCEKGQMFESKEYRGKELLTVLGPVIVQRAYYYDRDRGEEYCPKDVVLDIAETSFSPGLRRIIARVGAYRPFGLGHADIKEMAGIEVDPKAIERVSHRLGKEVEGFYQKEGNPFLLGNIVLLGLVGTMYICMDGTGVPVVKPEAASRKGKGEQGQAKTREAKLGCVFTQTTVDEKAYPKRDEGSTSYVGAIEKTEVFGNRIYAEVLRRGLERAQRVCVIGDAAPWVWNIAEEHFYGAIQIIDLFYARQHYWNVARAAFGSHQEKLNQWTERRRKGLYEGKVEGVIKAIQRLAVPAFTLHGISNSLIFSNEGIPSSDQPR